jgi:hypothetical protein
MRALECGWPGGRFHIGAPPPGDDPFICYGQLWGADRWIPPALKAGRRFWQIDNGFYKSAKGTAVGYYRFMYCRPDPIFLENSDLRAERAKAIPPDYRPWRKNGDHVVLAEPGPDLGKAFGMSMDGWLDLMKIALPKFTKRPIKLRPRHGARTTLEQDLRGAWALVTHSSNVGFDAIMAGIPVVVEPTSMCWPIATPIDEIETPMMPERKEWWSSLMCQQFTISEMADGTAHRFLSAVALQIETES